MSDAADEPGPKIASGNEPAGPAGAEKAQRSGGKTFVLAAQWNEKAEEPGAAQEKCGSEEQGNNRSDGGKHM